MHGWHRYFLSGSFTWPTFATWLIPLMAFKRRPEEGRIVATIGDGVGRISGALAAVGYAAIVLASYFSLGLRPVNPRLPGSLAWLAVNTALGAAYLALGVFCLVREIVRSDIIRFRETISWRGIGAAALCALTATLVATLALRQPSSFSGGSIFIGDNSIFIRSVALPAGFLVAHAVYLGPIVLLFALLWPEICRTLVSWGVGFGFFGALTLFFSITTESRHLIHALPLMTLAAVATLDRLSLSTRMLPIVAAASALSSRTWFHINPIGDAFFGWPGQRLFMVVGPWMEPECYAIQGIIMLAFLAAFYRIARKRTDDSVN